MTHLRPFYLTISSSSSQWSIAVVHPYACLYWVLIKLYFAFVHGSTAIISSPRQMLELLIDSGSDINAQNIVGDAPLHKAAINGRALAADFLIRAGANVNIRCCCLVIYCRPLNEETACFNLYPNDYR